MKIRITTIDKTNATFQAIVNNKVYYGTYLVIGRVVAITGMHRILSIKETTWKIITYTETQLNNCFNTTDHL